MDSCEGEMMNLEERMVEVLGDFEAAHRAAWQQVRGSSGSMNKC